MSALLKEFFIRSLFFIPRIRMNVFELLAIFIVTTRRVFAKDHKFIVILRKLKCQEEVEINEITPVM